MAIRLLSMQAKFTTPDLDIPELGFGDINLIYGLNESGKTAIVDFLLHSLFKGYKDFPQRSQDASGKVLVGGLAGAGNEPTTFNYRTGDRLEKYWAAANPTFPIDMARLLVVRGADSSFSQEEAQGVSKRILRGILGTAQSIDDISGRISTTVQNASIENGAVSGSSRGDIKTRDEKERDLARVDRLQQRLEDDYATGTVASLQLQLAKEQELLSQMERARRHRAYELNQQLDDLKLNIRSLPTATLESLRRNIHTYQGRRDEINKKTADVMNMAAYSERLPWLEQAVPSYERLLQPQASTLPRPIWLILAAACLAATVVAAFLRLPGFAAAAAALCAVFGACYVWSQKTTSPAVLLKEERLAIQKEFEQRFGRPLATLADLKAVHDEHRSMDERARLWREDIDSIGAQLAELKAAIERDFHSLNKKPAASEWLVSVDESTQELGQLQQREQQLTIQLAQLDLPPEEFADEPAAVSFDLGEWKRLQHSVDATSNMLRNEEERLNSLKQAICSETAKDITTSWPDLIEALGSAKAEKLNAYQEITAKVAAGILVSQALSSFHEKEDELIRQGLQTPSLREMLRRLTGVYDGFDLAGDEVILLGGNEPQPFSVLSTGTREQALLALRLGFASIISGRQPLFLILDDAFQHSDYKRRLEMVKTLGEVAASGWQVLCFSMDDHIRGLFEKKLKPSFKDRFKLHVLG